MSAVGIWSMHFIGNRAIVMDHGQAAAQIVYSAGWTAASFFVPTVAVACAFYCFNFNENVSISCTLGGGILTGASVCGMHYMGQKGISNYAPTYKPRYIAGSAVTACFACTAALGMFFYFKSVWLNHWWRRVPCALFLAAAVSSMHWIATAGTMYHLRSNGHHVSYSGLSKNTVVIVVILLVRTLITQPPAFVSAHSRRP